VTSAEAQALAAIHGLAGANRVRFVRPHAYERMDERGAVESDVVHALVTATARRLQDNGRYKVSGGTDLDGDALTAVVKLEADVLVITLF
jgi:hypothetical protein